MKKKSKDSAGSGSKKDGTKEVPTKTEALIDDFTSSLTDSFSLDQKVAENILGKEALRKPSKAQALIRCPVRFMDSEILSLLGLEDLDLDPATVLIHGPLDPEKIKEWAEKGSFNRHVQIQISYSRWKGLKEVFPDLKSSRIGIDEITDTSNTAEKTSTQTATEEISGLDLESIEELKNHSSAMSSGSAYSLDNLETRASTKYVPHESLAIENEADYKTTFVRKKSISEEPTQLSSESKDSQKVSWMGTIIVGAVVLAGGFYFLSKKEKSSSTPPLEISKDFKSEMREKRTLEYPENLRPLGIQSLYRFLEKPGLMPLRSLMLQYDFTYEPLKDSQVQLLKSLADPAAASLEGQKIATNILASHWMDQGKVGEAKKLLSKLVEQGDTDSNTFLNLALAHFLEGEYPIAREMAGSGLRLCNSSNCWLANCLLGMVDILKDRFEEGQRHFQTALSRSSQNPLPYGLWLYALLKSPQAFRLRSPTILKDALWADPDRWVDAPLRAPMAARVLNRLSLEGFNQAGKESHSLTVAQRNFLLEMTEGYQRTSRWVKQFDPSALLQEENLQSQVLGAYVLASQGKLQDASEVIGRVSQLLTSDRVTGSWPWSLAGDVQFMRGQMDLASFFYQAALSRSQLNSAAVLGMALALRDKNNFLGSQQKFSEAEGQDPLFIPAVLKMPRHEWKRIRENTDFSSVFR